MPVHPLSESTSETLIVAQPPLSRRGFAILQNRNFRYLLMALVGDSITNWVEQLARSWLVWELTGSPLLLALINLTKAVPLLVFSLVAGALADRFNKKYILLLASSASLIFKLITAVIITTGVVEVWHVYLLGFLLGISQAFNQPVKNALIPDVVDNDSLVSATALSEGGKNIPKVVGPGIAGSLMVFIGIDGIYYISAGIYLFVIACILLIRAPAPQPATSREGVLAALVGGGRYAARHRPVLAVLLLSISPVVLGMPYMTILPIFSDQVLHAGVAGFGWLLSARALGMVISSLVMAYLGEFRRQGLALWLSAMGHSAILVSFVFFAWFPLSMALMTAIGLTDAPYKALSRAILLHITPPDMQGRIMGLYFTDKGLSPLGSMSGGVLAEFFGAPIALGSLAALSVAFCFGVGMWEPRVRKL